MGRSDRDAAGGGKSPIATELSDLFAHFALQCVVDSKKGGVANFEVENFAFSAGVGGEGVELIKFVLGSWWGLRE